MPPGYHVEKRRDANVVLAGVAVFGLGYGLAVLAAATSDRGPDHPHPDALYVPSLGPFIALDDPKAGHEAGFAFGGVAGLQIGGLLAIALGLVPRATLVPDATGRPQPTPTVIPALRRAGPGLAWTF